jgi:dihydroorotate dehydrogenase
MIHPLVISAPFGNYVQPAGATATLGTFTAARRPGRWWRVLRTVRWYPRAGAWINQIGLRNPGIQWLLERVRAGRIDPADKIISIHGFDGGEWRLLLARAAELRPLAIELNMSCPNVGRVDWPADLFERAATAGPIVIVKLPPVNYGEMVRRAHDAGLRWFHCCNTIPVPRGGVSGKPLKPFSIRCIGDVREAASKAGVSDEVRIIGGGGITSPGDVDEYADAGADRVAIGTKAMNPLLLVSEAPLRAILRRAHERLGPQG